MENKDFAAFPITAENSSWGGNNKSYQGLSKREYFAAMAMQGFISKGAGPSDWVAKHAVKYADELLKELEK